MGTLLVMWLAVAGNATLDPSEDPILASGGYRLHLSLLDAPFNLTGGVPSMRQSADIAHATVEGANFGIDAFGQWIEKKSGKAWARWLAEAPMLLGWGALESQLPFGSGWAHEEWHRAVLQRFGVGSFDELYLFQLFASTHSVSHVSDAGLASIKARSPSDFVRLAAAGLEAQTFVTLETQRDIFFDRRTPWRDLPWIAYSRLNTFIYLSVCLSPSAMTDARAQEASETSLLRRDFTGLDCTAWAYDLEHPDEAYADRGLHPTGNGVARYRYLDQLSPRGRGFLERARWLSLLGFASPQLFGLQRLPLFAGGEWNLALTHMLTSFGQVVDANVWLQWTRLNVSLTFHAYVNARGSFPGVELSLVRVPFGPRAARAAGADTCEPDCDTSSRSERAGPGLRASASIGVWSQPDRFDSVSARAGVIVRAGLSARVFTRLRVFVEADGKTAGWVAGNVYLGAATQARFGLEAEL